MFKKIKAWLYYQIVVLPCIRRFNANTGKSIQLNVRLDTSSKAIGFIMDVTADHHDWAFSGLDVPFRPAFRNITGVNDPNLKHVQNEIRTKPLRILPPCRIDWQ